MDTQVMNVSGNNSGPQPSYSPRGPVNPGVNPQAVSASSPLWVDPKSGQKASYHSPDRVSGLQPQYAPRIPPVGQPRPEPQFQGKVQRSVQERHEAFQRAAEALHDRHYEDNNIRLEAELRLAEFFLS